MAGQLTRRVHTAVLNSLIKDKSFPICRTLEDCNNHLGKVFLPTVQSRMLSQLK